MARYLHGINGPFVGRVGNVVASSWRGIPYLKSRPVRKKALSKNEKANLGHFGMTSQWLPMTLRREKRTERFTAYRERIGVDRVEVPTGVKATYHIYVAFVAGDGSSRSDSLYLGAIEVGTDAISLSANPQTVKFIRP